MCKIPPLRVLHALRFTRRLGAQVHARRASVCYNNKINNNSIECVHLSRNRIVEYARKQIRFIDSTRTLCFQRRRRRRQQWRQLRFQECAGELLFRNQCLRAHNASKQLVRTALWDNHILRMPAPLIRLICKRVPRGTGNLIAKEANGSIPCL